MPAFNCMRQKACIFYRDIIFDIVYILKERKFTSLVCHNLQYSPFLNNSITSYCLTFRFLIVIGYLTLLQCANNLSAFSNPFSAKHSESKEVSLILTKCLVLLRHIEFYFLSQETNNSMCMNFLLSYVHVDNSNDQEK